MKNSNANSRDKVTKPVSTSQNKLMKTAVQPKTQELESTNFNRPASGKRIESNKNLPPKGPVAKKQYIVADNMTESRINQAKVGLQLLKRKMSSKGMSRQKQQPVEEVKTVSKKVIASKQQNYEENQDRNNIPSSKNIRKKVSQTEQPIQQKNKPMIPNKKVPSQKQAEYQNQSIEIPIKPKKDFNALLEEQLRKQNQGKGIKTNQMPSEYPDEGGELVECQQGCGRMFNCNAIVKHEKVCQKVFQSKRKAFNSAAFRAPEVQGGIPQLAPQLPPQKKAQVAAKQKNPIKQESNIPKWKAQSLAFRAGLKQSNGTKLSKQQQKALQNKDGGLVQCSSCGRKFNEKAAERHIPFCQSKSKQIHQKKR